MCLVYVCVSVWCATASMDAELNKFMTDSFISIFAWNVLETDSWIYSMGQKNGLRAFGYNSAENILIWTKFGTL